MLAKDFSYVNNGKDLEYFLLYALIKSLTQVVGEELVKLIPTPMLQVASSASIIEFTINPPIFVPLA